MCGSERRGRWRVPFALLQPGEDDPLQGFAHYTEEVDGPPAFWDCVAGFVGFRDRYDYCFLPLLGMNTCPQYFSVYVGKAWGMGSLETLEDRDIDIICTISGVRGGFGETDDDFSARDWAEVGGSVGVLLHQWSFSMLLGEALGDSLVP